MMTIRGPLASGPYALYIYLLHHPRLCFPLCRQNAIQATQTTTGLRLRKGKPYRAVSLVISTMPYVLPSVLSSPIAKYVCIAVSNLSPPTWSPAILLLRIYALPTGSNTIKVGYGIRSCHARKRHLGIRPTFSRQLRANTRQNILATDPGGCITGSPLLHSDLPRHVSVPFRQAAGRLGQRFHVSPSCKGRRSPPRAEQTNYRNSPNL